MTATRSRRWRQPWIVAPALMFATVCALAAGSLHTAARLRDTVRRERLAWLQYLGATFGTRTFTAMSFLVYEVLTATENALDAEHADLATFTRTVSSMNGRRRALALPIAFTFITDGDAFVTDRVIASRLTMWLRDTIATMQRSSGVMSRVIAGPWTVGDSAYVIALATVPPQRRVLGFAMPLSALARRVLERAYAGDRTLPAFAGEPLLPPALLRGAGNRDAFAVAVRDRSGAELWSSGRMTAQTTIAIPGDPLGGGTLSLALLPGAAAIVGRERDATWQTIALVGLVAMTGALLVFTWRVLRREAAVARVHTDFVASVSHELRTPLAQILMYGELLSLDRMPREDARYAAYDLIVRETRRLARLVENVLHFSRLERNALRPALRPVSLARVLEDVLDAFAPIAADSDATLDVAIDDGAIALGDEEGLRQVVSNVLDNALKYGPRGQTVQVRVAAHAQSIDVSVRDEGPGVPATMRVAVWEPFVRLPRDVESGRPGSGIGLAVVRELVSYMGGETRIDDSPHGACVVVSLKRAA